MAEGHEQFDSIDIDAIDADIDVIDGKLRAIHANASSQDSNALIVDLDNIDVKLMEQTSSSNKLKYKFMLIIFIFLWLVLSSCTLAGFILAFSGNTAMFRYSYLLFCWFMTILNLPFIIRPILKSMSLWHDEMDEFSNTCFYFLHRFLHIGFITINLVNTILLLNGTAFLGCFLIGIHNVILAFKVGAFLAMPLKGIKFHAAHFLLMCLAVGVAGGIWGFQNGLLLLGSIVIWFVDFAIFLVVTSTLKREQKKYHEQYQYRPARHAKIKQEEKAQIVSQNNNSSPKDLSLRVNDDRKADDHEASVSAKLRGSVNISIDMDAMEIIPPGKKAKPEVQRYKTRKVTCCCHHFGCGLRTCLQVQTLVTAASIWGSVALFLLNKISWTCYGLMVFVSVTTVYNPICFTKRCYRITTAKKCCTCDKFWLCLAYFFGIITILVTACLCTALFIVANPFSVGNIDETLGQNITDSAQVNFLGINATGTKVALMYSVWIIALLSFLNYLPGAGWVFYQIPVAFAMINFLSFVVFLLVPMILVNTFLNDEATPCITAEDFTCNIQNKSVVRLYNFLYNGYENRLQDGEELLYIPHLTALISFTIYLSLTGLGCSWYRFKKAMIESQANLTGNIKGQYSKDFPMGLIMFFTLSFAFGDVVSDAVYAFGTRDEQWASPSLKWLTISLFSMQILIQIISFNDVISQLRQSLHGNQSLPFCGCCYKYCTLCYMILTFPYYIIVFVIGIFLGLSKLFAIKQVQEWWFRLIIPNYQKEVEKARSKTLESVQHKLKLVNNSSESPTNDGIEIEVDVVVNDQQKMIKGWECSHCEMINDEVNVICGGCYMEKDDEAMKAWQCKNCGMMNDKTHVICGGCYNSKTKKDDHDGMQPAIGSMNAPKPMINDVGTDVSTSQESDVINIELNEEPNNILKTEETDTESTDDDDVFIDVESKESENSNGQNVSPMNNVADADSIHVQNISAASVDINAQIESALNDINTENKDNDLEIITKPSSEYVNEDLPTPDVDSEQIADIIAAVQNISSQQNLNLQQNEILIETEKVKEVNFNVPSASSSPVVQVEPVFVPNDIYIDDIDDIDDIRFDEVETRSRAGTKIHDVSTPKMAKLREKLSYAQDEQVADGCVELMTFDKVDVYVAKQTETNNNDDVDIEAVKDIKDKKEEHHTSRKEKLEHLMDEDGTWLGYKGFDLENLSSNNIIWRIYLFIEGFTPLWMSKLKVRANIYNSYFVAELIIESWPQLVTNLVNSYYKGFSIISNISAVFSVIMILYTMFKIIYYVGIHNRNLDKIVL